MADATLTARAALSGEITAKGLHIAPVDHLRWTAINLRRGRQEALAGRLRAAFGLAMPKRAGASFAGEATLIWAGLERLTLIESGAAAADVAEAVGDAGMATDLTGGQVTVAVTGPAAPVALGRMVGIDLHPRAFSPGSAATTLCGHFGVTLWQVDAAPGYRLSSNRSFAGALWRALQLAAMGLPAG